MTDMSRRAFLTAGAAGALGVAGCAPQTGGELADTGNQENWDEETEVIVVGFGGGGGAAAIEAFDNGAQVLVLDASDTPGGATSINGGVIQCGGGRGRQRRRMVRMPESRHGGWFRRGSCPPSDPGRGRAHRVAPRLGSRDSGRVSPHRYPLDSRKRPVLQRCILRVVPRQAPHAARPCRRVRAAAF